MTSMSYLWNCPGGAGDGLNSLTRADWSTISKIFSACNGPEGVAPGYGNGLEGTVTGANTVSINSGGALVNGKPYNNDAALVVNIPSAVGAGNTRKDRIVLRADWTAQTVRIFRIAGIDAASPTAPATTQISGTLYDVPLYVATVTTAGTVTLTDERWFALIEQYELAAGASKITHRQGGSATDWTVAGPTNYPLTEASIQLGVSATPLPTDSIVVTFPVAFSEKPIVMIQPLDDVANAPYPSDITTTQFRANIGAVSTSFFWMASGKE
jgi:hypothetical protein